MCTALARDGEAWVFAYFSYALLLGGIWKVVIAFFNKEFFCADCGQYLGIGWLRPQIGRCCPRCGCNVYDTEFTGVGLTYRDGGKNH